MFYYKQVKQIYEVVNLFCQQRVSNFKKRIFRFRKLCVFNFRILTILKVFV